MSRLKLYWPDARGQVNGAAPVAVSNDQSAEPAVIPFSRTNRWSGADSPSSEVIERAATLRANCVCPACRRPGVEPIELNDAVLGRGNLPIPGTATLVGFRCNGCDTEWPA